MAKQVIFLTVLAVLVFSLTACGGGEKGVDAPSVHDETGDEIVAETISSLSWAAEAACAASVQDCQVRTSGDIAACDECVKALTGCTESQAVVDYWAESQ